MYENHADLEKRKNEAIIAAKYFYRNGVFEDHKPRGTSRIKLSGLGLGGLALVLNI